jgi:CheY-like chemotaxis protein
MDLDAIGHATRIAGDVLLPGSDAIDRSGAWPVDGIRALQAAGLGGPVISRELGGSGQGLLAVARVCEVLGHACPSTAMSVRSKGGLGLGLSIVRNLVELHAGTVFAASESGRGGEFPVRLPATAEPPVRRENRSAPCDTVGEDGARVLLVDDNVDAVQILSELLRGLGYVTAVAHDGPSALAIALQFVPEIALLDIGLPVMDGYALVRHLRAIPGLEGLISIAVTGYGADLDRARTREAGFAAHLVKPVGMARLRRALEAAAAQVKTRRGQRGTP